MKNPCIVLEGVVCEGVYNANCPRAIYAVLAGDLARAGRRAGRESPS